MSQIQIQYNFWGLYHDLIGVKMDPQILKDKIMPHIKARFVRGQISRLNLPLLSYESYDLIKISTFFSTTPS